MCIPNQECPTVPKNRKANLQIATKIMHNINQNLQRNFATGQADVSFYIKDCIYAANWYENGKKVRQYFSVIRYSEEQAKQLAIEACLCSGCMFAPRLPRMGGEGDGD
jgi:hypothetical protein